MKTVQFKELINISFDIHDMIIMEQHWRTGEKYTIQEGGRPDNGIMFLCDCEFEYPDSKKDQFDRAVRNQIVYSPIGSKYTCRFDLAENHIYEKAADYLINFRLYDEKSGEEFRLSEDRLLITPENPKKYFDKFGQIVSLQSKGTLLRPRIKGLFYDLLCCVSLELQRSDIMTRRYAPIYPAIKYLRTTDIAELDVSGLASLCHLSESCFRRLFTEYFGKPPHKYINELRANKASELLKSGIMTVSEVAESLGFADTAYFSRFYKREMGKSPRFEIE